MLSRRARPDIRGRCRPRLNLLRRGIYLPDVFALEGRQCREASGEEGETDESEIAHDEP